MKKNMFWLVWIFLITIYIATIAALCGEGQYSALVFAVLNVACGVFLFYAEGFEVAFCMLWPAREAAEANIRNVLRNLDPEFVLAQRQVIVVVTITIVSVTTSALDWIVIPGLGKVRSFGAPYLFSLAFTTSTILWFCQVFPKRAAARSAEHFWRFSHWLLKLIILAGKIDLPSPSGDLLRWWEALFGRPQCASPQNSKSTHVPSLWASCDCAVCNPQAERCISPPSTAVDVSSVACGCAVCSCTAPKLGQSHLLTFETRIGATPFKY